MKTFIWNTEYDVLAASSDCVESARRLLLHEFVRKGKQQMIDEEDRKTIATNSLPSYVLARAEGYLNYNLETFIEIYKREPDVIIEHKQAIIYTHANE